MPFEVQGLDISQPENRDIVLDVYSFFARKENDTDFIDYPDLYQEWIEQSPNEANEYLLFCANHTKPEIRSLAGSIAGEWLESQPVIAPQVMQKTLRDTDPNVQQRCIEYYYDMLTDTGYEILEKIGMTQMRQLISTFDEVAPGFREHIHEDDDLLDN
jgi:hypothetical protein